MQNPNFAWRSCSNHREKHRMAFANVVEGYLNYNFRIYCFCRTVQIFEDTRGQSRVNRLKTDRPRSRAPTARRAPCRLGCAAHCATSASVLARFPPPRGTSHQFPSRRHPRNACHIFYRAVPAPSAPRSVARATAERVHRGPSPYCGVMAGASRRREDRELTGYKSRPRYHAQAGRHDPPSMSRHELLSPDPTTTDQAP
jgi:hypothetical protein